MRNYYSFLLSLLTGDQEARTNEFLQMTGEPNLLRSPYVIRTF